MDEDANFLTAAQVSCILNMWVLEFTLNRPIGQMTPTRFPAWWGYLRKLEVPTARNPGSRS